MFNNLNNIYTLSLIDPEKTPDYLLKLADILRYLLRTGEAEQVTVNEDLHFCKRYIDLQTLRHSDTSGWNIEIEETAEMVNFKPFLLISFIENVFKYGVHPEKPAPIIIRVRTENRILELYTHNLKVNKKVETLLESHRIGLKKTINLLNHHYEKHFELTINDREDSFEVKLTIDLNE